jgi:carboxylesterase type B
MRLEGKGSSERCSVYADEGAKGGKEDERKASDDGKTIKLGWGSQNNGGLFLQVLVCCSCAGVLLFMMFFSFLPLALSLSGSLAAAAVSNTQTSLTLLYQNNLNGTDDENHIGFILLGPATKEEAPGLCTAIGESLISSSEIKGHSADFVDSFTYLAYAGRTLQVQQYSILEGVATFTESDGEISFQPYPSGNPKLPVLCTQSSNQNQPGNAVATASNEVTITSTGNTYVGFRNQKSFRFLGIAYANPPKRFTYSVPYSPKGQTLNATAYAPECPQYGSGAESCLFLNIQTPYLPKQGSSTDLRPVFFWIHGGGFVTGSALDQGVDGGNLASREDIVVVQIQYRLATLGFLAIPGTDIKGNFGIADQITALQVRYADEDKLSTAKVLQWVIENIASFGGDPNQITIGGDSAGAGSVRTLLGSPPANRKFQGAIAMSNLGGDVDLGQSGGYSTTYSSYLTISESYAIAGQNIFQAAGCNQTTLDAQIACLEVFPASILSGLSAMARYVVQDGTYVNTEQLDVRNHNGSTAFVPAMFGVCHDDGASIGATYPSTPVTSEVAGIEASLGISAFYAQEIIDSGLFPYYNTGNITLDSFNVSARVATDMGFRCVDEATMYAASQSGAFAASYFYQMQRTIGGYDPNGLGGPPVTPGYPNGNPNLPYFRFHSGATDPFIFGNVSPIRDPDDLYAAQLNSGYFSQFVKDGQPNPSETYLEKRNYVKTLEAVKQTGSWMNIKDKDGPIRLLDYPSVESGFVDVPQCAFLNYSLSYYLDGGL